MIEPPFWAAIYKFQRILARNWTTLRLPETNPLLASNRRVRVYDKCRLVHHTEHIRYVPGCKYNRKEHIIRYIQSNITSRLVRRLVNTFNENRVQYNDLDSNITLCVCFN